MAEMTHLSTDRKAIRDLLARYPLVAFVALAYAITWIAWPLSYRFDFGVVNGFELIGSAGPALAAMIVSALLRPEPSGIPAGKRWRLFGIISILALAIMAALRLWLAVGLVTVSGRGATVVAYPTPMAFLMDILGAAVVAFVLSGVLSPRQGVRDLLHSLDPRSQPVRWYWWVFAVGFYPLVYALGNAISAAVGLPVTAPKATGLGYWVALDAFIMSLYGLVGGGGLEEPGWRGFALPLLQKRYSPLRSSLILAVIWAFWHWPMLRSGPLEMAYYLLLVVAPLAIVFTAVFNRTGGSLLIVILLHISINITEILLPASMLATTLWILPVLALAIWMWRSPHRFSIIKMRN
jgi:membrane protease YdiL (CAAX protease family)